MDKCKTTEIQNLTQILTCCDLFYSVDVNVLMTVILRRAVRREQSSSISIDRDRTKKICTICVVRPVKVDRSRSKLNFAPPQINKR